MTTNFKRRLAIGGTVLAAAALAGGAYAATQGSGNGRQAFLDDVAKRLNVSPQQLSGAFKGAYLDQLNAAVKAGRLTQAEANAIEQRIQQNGNTPLWPGPAAAGRGFGGAFRIGRRIAGSAAAGYLGVTEAQLVQQLRGGKSLAEIAKAHGKSVSGLEQTIISALKARLQQAVDSKLITAAQAQRIDNLLPTIVDRAVNNTGRFGPGRAPGFGRRGGFFAHPGAMPSQAPPGAGMPPAGYAPPPAPGPAA